ncbi:MAG: hypothetical protein AAGD06_16240 [Acidobacteriota bacterium]
MPRPQYDVVPSYDEFLLRDLRTDEVLIRFFRTRQAALAFADDPQFRAKDRWIPHRVWDTDLSTERVIPQRLRSGDRHFFLGRDEAGIYAVVSDPKGTLRSPSYPEPLPEEELAVRPFHPAEERLFEALDAYDDTGNLPDWPAFEPGSSRFHVQSHEGHFYVVDQELRVALEPGFERARPARQHASDLNLGYPDDVFEWQPLERLHTQVKTGPREAQSLGQDGRIALTGKGQGIAIEIVFDGQRFTSPLYADRQMALQDLETIANRIRDLQAVPTGELSKWEIEDLPAKFSNPNADLERSGQMPKAPISSPEYADDRAQQDFSKPSDRLRVVETDGNYRVAVLDRSRLAIDGHTFHSSEAAEQRRAELAPQLDARQVDPNNWSRLPRQYAERFEVREVEGQFHAAYVGSRNTFLRTEAYDTREEAKAAVDQLQRAAARGDQADLRGDAWNNDSRRQSYDRQIANNPYAGDDFRIVEENGRHAVYYRDQRFQDTFPDRADAEQALAHTWAKLEKGGRLNEAQWPRVAPEQLPAPDSSKLPKSVRAALDGVVESPGSKESYRAAVDAVRDHLKAQLRPMGSREHVKILQALAKIQRTETLRDHQRNLRRQLARTPEALEARRAELEQQIRTNGKTLGALPNTDDLHHQMAKQLSGRQIDPAALLRPDANVPLPDNVRRLLQDDRFRDEAKRHLERFASYQQRDLPRAVVLSHLIQHKGAAKATSQHKKSLANLARRGASLRKMATTAVKPAVSIVLSAYHDLQRTAARGD